MLIHNPSDAPIVGFNRDKKVINIPCGETVDVDDYIGNGLLDTFGFLKTVKTVVKTTKADEVIVEVPEEAPSEEVEEAAKDPEVDEELPSNFLQLKKYAKEKGVEVTPHTTKEELLEALAQL